MKKIVVIDSKDKNSGSTSDFKFSLSTSINDVKKIRLVSCSIPNTSYNVRTGVNDQISITELTGTLTFSATINPGSYSISDLLLEIADCLTAQSALTGNTWIYTLTINSTLVQNNKVVISAGGVNSFTLNFGTGVNQINKLIGFSSVDLLTDTSHTSDLVANCLYPRIIYLDIDEFPSNTYTKNSSHTFSLICNGVSSNGEYIEFNENTQFNQICFDSSISKTINNISVKLRDENERILDLNGNDWILILQLN